MKKILLLTVVMAVTAFSAQASNGEILAKFFGQTALVGGLIGATAASITYDRMYAQNPNQYGEYKLGKATLRGACIAATTLSFSLASSALAGNQLSPMEGLCVLGMTIGTGMVGASWVAREQKEAIQREQK